MIIHGDSWRFMFKTDKPENLYLTKIKCNILVRFASILKIIIYFFYIFLFNWNKSCNFATEYVCTLRICCGGSCDGFGFCRHHISYILVKKEAIASSCLLKSGKFQSTQDDSIRLPTVQRGIVVLLYLSAKVFSGTSEERCERIQLFRALFLCLNWKCIEKRLFQKKFL